MFILSLIVEKIDLFDQQLESTRYYKLLVTITSNICIMYEPGIAYKILTENVNYHELMLLSMRQFSTCQ